MSTKVKPPDVNKSNTATNELLYNQDNAKSSLDFINSLTDYVTKKQKNIFNKLLEKERERYDEQLNEMNKEQEKKLDINFQEKAKELDSKQIRVIETLGLFFALFTFISINVQIFSRTSNLFSAGIFTLLMFCSLSLMLILFNYLLMLDVNKSTLAKHTLIHGGLFLIIILVAFCCLYIFRNIRINPVENTPEFNDAVDKRVKEKIEPFYYNKDDINKILLPTRIQPQ